MKTVVNSILTSSEPAVDGKVPEDSDMRGQFGIRPYACIVTSKRNIVVLLPF